MTEEVFSYLLTGMVALGLVVFVSLYFITAGYGQFHTKQWGWSINNKVGWVLMEAPAFLTMLGIWYASGIYYVDHSFRISTKREALEVGRQYSQISIYGWKTQKLAYC